MSLYSSDTRIGNIGGPDIGKFIPFIAYARIVPVIATTRHREYWHDMERKAQAVEDALLAADFHIAVPVAFTPTFRQAPARLTIVGFYDNAMNPSAPTFYPAEPLIPKRGIIHSGTVEGEKTARMHPPNGTQTWGDNPTATNMAITKALKIDLDAAIAGITVNGVAKTWTCTIFYMDVASVKYGQLPNKKGFFSFPQ